MIFYSKNLTFSLILLAWLNVLYCEQICSGKRSSAIEMLLDALSFLIVLLRAFGKYVRVGDPGG